MSTSLAGATQDEVRRHNLSRLVRILHLNGSVSRADLTRLTGLNRSTVGALTTDLARAGIAHEGAPIGRGVGRPSIVVTPNSDNYALAFDLRVERTIAAVVSLGGLVTHRQSVPHARGTSEPSEVLADMSRLIADYLGQASSTAVCLGVGIAVPGIVRHSDGFVHLAPNMGWVDVPLAAALTDLLGQPLPIVVGNDADMGAISEHLRGSAVRVTNAVFLSGEVGVGGGIILDGRPMIGAGGYGGEVGHMVVNPEGRVCRCGRRGCWETEIGEDAVLRALGGTAGDDIDVLLARAEKSGDANVLGDVAHWLGIGLANLVNIFNPEVIVFGGLLRRVLPLVESHLTQYMDVALVAPRQQVRFALPALGRDSALLGAAESVFTPLLNDPLGTVGRRRGVVSV